MALLPIVIKNAPLNAAKYFICAHGHTHTHGHQTLQLLVRSVKNLLWHARLGFSFLKGTLFLILGHKTDVVRSNNITQVFLRLNQFHQTYEVGCWTAAGDTTCLASYQIPKDDYKTWIHLAGVYDGTQWLLYRNGELVGQSPGKFGSLRVAGSEWAIGSKGGGGDRFFQGSIAFVSIWNVARSAQEIAEGMPSERDGDEHGLLGHWPLDDGRGVNARDVMGENDGQLQVRLAHAFFCLFACTSAFE